eukprot:4494899-Pleurochrysis_carterae.AAC.1
MRLCDALLSTSTPVSRRSTTLPLFVRNGRSTSQQYLGVVVPLAVTMRVETVQTEISCHCHECTRDAVHARTGVTKPH